MQSWRRRGGEADIPHTAAAGPAPRLASGAVMQTVQARFRMACDAMMPYFSRVALCGVCRQRLRKLEVTLMEYRDSLEERGIKDGAELERKVAAYRRRLETDAEAQAQTRGGRKGDDSRGESGSGRRDKEASGERRVDSPQGKERKRARSTEKTGSGRKRARSTSESPVRERSREKGRETRDRDKERGRERDRDREKEREREREKDKERARGRDKERERREKRR